MPPPMEHLEILRTPRGSVWLSSGYLLQLNITRVSTYGVVEIYFESTQLSITIVKEGNMQM